MIQSLAKPLRLVSYNILEGGLGRADPLAETLAWLDGDLAGLLECSDPALIAYLARKLRYDHALAESSHSDYHVALLSRLPILRLVNLGVRCEALRRTALEAIVDVYGQTLRIVVVHLHPGAGREDEQVRMAELDALLSVLDEEPGSTVMMGDFNAHARHHASHLSGATVETREKVERQGGLAHDVTDRLLERGWCDALHEAGGEAAAKHSFITAEPGSRVDYIWLDGELRSMLRAADVEQRGFTPYCSDHFPIWAALGPKGERP